MKKNIVSLRDRMFTKRPARGQGLTELAISLPLFFLLLTAGIDMSNIIYTYHRLAAATREGAKLVSQTGSAATSPALQQTAIDRTRLALTNSGIPWWDATVTAQVYNVDVTVPLVLYSQQSYQFLSIRAGYQPNLFFGRVLSAFGFQNIPFTTLTAQSTAYNDSTGV